MSKTKEQNEELLERFIPLGASPTDAVWHERQEITITMTSRAIETVTLIALPHRL
jgi:hypothetical protein